MCYGNKHCYVPGLDFYYSHVIVTHDLWHAMRQEDKSELIDTRDVRNELLISIWRLQISS